MPIPPEFFIGFFAGIAFILALIVAVEIRNEPPTAEDEQLYGNEDL